MPYSPASLLNPVDFGVSLIGTPILYVVRHAQNDDDAEGKIRGLKDQRLNEEGEKQLGRLRAFFAARPIAAVVSDDLSRTRATAMAIAQVWDLGVDTDLELRSWDLGKLEGRSIDANKFEIQDLKTHPDKTPIGGESWAIFRRKCFEASERWIQRAMSINGPIAIVTHGSFIQIFFEAYSDWDASGNYDHTPLDQCGVAALYLARGGYDLKILRGAKENIDE